jgi:hypothetical protein
MSVIDWYHKKREGYENLIEQREQRRRESEIHELEKLRLKAKVSEDEANILHEKEELREKIRKTKVLRQKAGSGFLNKTMKIAGGLGEFGNRYTEAAKKSGQLDYSIPTVDSSMGMPIGAAHRNKTYQKIRKSHPRYGL